MKFQGIATFVFRDKDTGEVTKTVESTNHVQNWWLLQLASSGALSTLQQLGDVLFVSDTNPGKQKRDWPQNIDGCRGGTPIGGIPQLTVSYDDSPGIHLGQFVMRFGPPAQNYTINIAGICDSVTTGTAINACTVVWLETACVQTTTETLDLYYRVQMLFEDDWSVYTTDSNSLNPYDTAHLASYFFGDYAGYLLPSSGVPYAFPNTKFNGRLINSPNMAFVGSTWQQWGGTGLTFNVVGEPEYFVRRNTLSRDIQTAVGMQLGWIGVYVNEQPGMIQKSLPSTFSPLQSVFGHRSTSGVPFYSSANSQLGLGVLTINADSWTNPDFPQYVRLEITTSGALGVAQYQFRKRASLGFFGNTWISHPGSALPFTQSNHGHLYNDGFIFAKDIDESVFTTSGAEAMDRSGMAYAAPLDSDPNKLMAVWKDEFAIVDVHDGTGTAVTNTTLVGIDVTPRFLATDISQVAVDNSGDYYISCRNTGLYKLNAAMDTLTVIDSSTTGLTGVTGCKAICKGQGNRLWAYWGHATTPDIYYSDNSGTSWTAAVFSDVFVDANPGLVFNIQADPNAAGGKLALLYYSVDELSNPVQDIMVTWWDHALTTNTNFGKIRGISRTQFFGSLANPYEFHAGCMNILKCSPNQSYWGTMYSNAAITAFAQPAYLTFGTATVNALGAGEDVGTYMHNTNFVPDAAGNDAILYISDKGQANNQPTNASMTVLVSQNLTYEAGDSTGDGSNSYDGIYAHHYLQSGIWLCARVYSGDFLSHSSRNLYFTYCGIPIDADIAGKTGMLNEFYPTWGWTGTVWQKGHAGTKPTHGAAEALIDGVTVSWDDTAGPHLDSDHYTFGIYDGIWLDGSTQFDFRWDLYAKPSTYGTDVEAATLPVATKVSNNFIIDIPDTDVTDIRDEQSTTLSAAGRLTATGTAGTGVYNAGCRSNYPAVDGTAQSFLPNQTYIPDTDTNNCQGYIQFDIYNSASLHLEYYVGLSAIGILGTALSNSTIAHALHFDSVTPGSGVGTCTLRVTENGVERASIIDIPYNNSATASQRTKGRIALLTNQSVQYEYYVDGYGWQILYTSPPGSVTIQDLYLDTHYVPTSTYGLYDLSWNYLDTSNPDYYLYLGDGIDQGVFQPEFYCIDPTSVKITIAGIEAVHIGINDQVTVLSTNSYSILPHSGVIRYSAADTGATVTAEYITVHHE